MKPAAMLLSTFCDASPAGRAGGLSPWRVGGRWEVGEGKEEASNGVVISARRTPPPPPRSAGLVLRERGAPGMRMRMTRTDSNPKGGDESRDGAPGNAKA
jgi:hypothetical protein